MLTVTNIRNTTKPGMYTDGAGRYGLFFVAKKSARGGLRKTFSQRVTIAGKRTMIGLGRCEFVTLAEARTMAFENARSLARGGELVHGGKRRTGPVPAARAVPTFAAACDAYIAARRAGWKAGSRNEANWRSSLAHAANLDDRPVDTITLADVAEIVVRLIGAGKVPTARSIRQRMRSVFDWCVAHGHMSVNPGNNGALDALLPSFKHSTEHRKAVPVADVPGALRCIRGIEKPTWRGMVAATEFLILTGMRSAEVTGARWEEIDFDAATWTVPAARMKMNRDHSVPLCGAALDVLRAMRKRRQAGYVFRAARGGRIDRLIPVLREVGIRADIHGFRSALRDWCSQNGVDDTVAERCIAHYETDSTRKPYHRTDRFDDRVSVMERWASFVTGEAPGGRVRRTAGESP